MYIISFIHPNSTLRVVSSSSISIKETQDVGRSSKMPLSINVASTEEIQHRGLSVGKAHAFSHCKSSLLVKLGDVGYCLHYEKEELEEFGILILSKRVRSLINLMWKRDKWGLWVSE